MRLVRFEDRDDGVAIELHPLITVVSGLSDAARQRLDAAAQAIPAGTDPGARGAVEVHGVMLELSRETLELLELDDPDLDVVIRADDLPGHPAHTHEEPAEVTPEAPRTTAAPNSPELDEARRILGRATGARDDARAERERAVEGHDRVATRLRAFEAEIESARDDLDPESAAAVGRARAEISAAEARAAAMADAQVADARRAAKQRVEALNEQADALRAEIARLRAIDPEPIRFALSRVAEAEPAPMVPSPEAARLADEIVKVTDQLALSEGRVAGGRNQLMELTARRDAAYDAFVVAEQALRTPELDQTIVEHLEQLHDQIFELDTKMSRLSASRNRRRLLELKSEEDELLERLGYSTWSNYVMGVSNADAEAERMRKYEVAKATYDFAEDELAKAAMGPRDDVDIDVLARRRDALLDRAHAMLGTLPSDPVVALRAMLVSAPREGDPLARELDTLVGLLRQAGMDVTADDPAGLQRAATRWLEEADSSRYYVAEIEADHGRITNEIAELDAKLATLDRARSVGIETPELASMRAALAEAEGRLARHEKAVGSLASLEEQAGELRGRAREIAAAASTADERYRRAESQLEMVRQKVGEIEQQVAASIENRVASRPVSANVLAARRDRENRESRERDRGSIEWTVLARMARQRSSSFVGSIPIVLDDAFVNWSYEDLGEVLERIRRMSDVIQVILLTDDVDIARWARELGRDRALVVDFASA
jgi:hypothetical protein